MRLTSDGMRLLPYAKNLCRSFDVMQNEVSDLKNVQTGIIRIGTFSNVATHWLPKMIQNFQKDYPNIEYEMLLGDYGEIEEWILNGRVDFGFLRLPVNRSLETIELTKDELMAVIPREHPLAKREKFPIRDLQKDPFILLEKGEKAEIAKLLEKHQIRPNIRFTTWDDYAVMSMVEQGLGISILPKLILQRIPYDIVAKPLDVPASRTIGLAIRNYEFASAAVKRFLTENSLFSPEWKI